MRELDYREKVWKVRQGPLTLAAAGVGLLITAASFFGFKWSFTSNELDSKTDTVASQDVTINDLNKRITDQSGTIAINEADIAALQKDKAALEKDKSSLEAANGDLSRRNKDLSADVESLNSQLAAANAGQSSGSTSPDVSTPSTGPGSIRHKGSVSIAQSGDYIDLNAPPTDTKWGAGSTSGGNDTVYRSYGGLSLSGIDTLWVKKADYKTCSTATGYATAYSLREENFPEAPVICLRLSSDRYGTLVVTSDNGDLTTLDITIWNS
jgi:uncharacterized coiled-coil protein SlyX